ncbi:MAG: cupin domain-containing protein [Fretibacterium sp.]|nr:cupin domain-containing protein [Fretibacterium sp.]
MLFKEAEHKRAFRKDVQGGKGELDCFYPIPSEEGPQESRFRMVGRMTLAPGGILGLHTHETDEEVYIILSGKGLYTDSDGRRHEVGPGDVTLTMKGKKHALEALDEPLTFWAVIAR